MLINVSCLNLTQAASGFTDKLKEQISDIDVSDIGNQLAVVEYVEDIYKFYKLSEVIFQLIAEINGVLVSCILLFVPNSMK